MIQPEHRLIEERKKKLETIRSMGINPYPYTFDQKHHSDEILLKYSKIKAEEKTNDKVSIAGRITSLRQMGKASFGHIQDSAGKIQFYIKEDEVGNENYRLFKLLDMGDIVGIKGTVFKTKTGEVSVWVKNIELLSKSLHPMPEKWHGLKDPEIRYRQRYLDLISNYEVAEVFKKRAIIIDEMRSFLKEERFIEVDTPTLQPVYGGAEAKPFTTRLNALNMNVYLQISPELYLKRLVIGGMEKVFFIGKNFRNEGVDRTHNPEFTMMECYEAYADYNKVMQRVENMISQICRKVNGSTKVKYGDAEIDFKTPWKKMTMFEAIKKYAGLDVEKMSEESLKKKIRELNLETGSKDEMINSIFEELVEKNLVQPAFITDYPLTICPLTKVHRKNPKLVERFEAFVNGTELANAYSELNDPVEQDKRFSMQEEKRKEGKEEAHPKDMDFVEAMYYGMPPCGGVGIGIDRLVMFLTNQHSIRDVIPFPFMKPLEENKNI